LDWSGAELREVGVKAAMGRLFLMHLDGNVYSCKHCKTHLGVAGDIISKVPLDPSASPRCQNKKNLFLIFAVPAADACGEADSGCFPWCFDFFQAFHCKHGKAYLFHKV